MAKVTLDYSKTEKFIRQDEVKAFARIAEAAKEVHLSAEQEREMISWAGSTCRQIMIKKSLPGSKKRQRRFRVIQKCFW